MKSYFAMIPLEYNKYNEELFKSGHTVLKTYKACGMDCCSSLHIAKSDCIGI
jgi:hypothetical protein